MVGETHDLEILDEALINDDRLTRKKQWLRGSHPHLGTITIGLSGIETLHESVMIPNLRILEVVD